MTADIKWDTKQNFKPITKFANILGKLWLKCLSMPKLMTCPPGGETWALPNFYRRNFAPTLLDMVALEWTNIIGKLFCLFGVCCTDIEESLCIVRLIIILTRITWPSYQKGVREEYLPMVTKVDREGRAFFEKVMSFMNKSLEENINILHFKRVWWELFL